MNNKDNLIEDEKKIQEEIDVLQKKLAEVQAAKAAEEVKSKAVCEDEWLPPDDLAKESEEVAEADISTPISGYEANTVGALIAVLKRTCKPTDLVLPRLNPDKKEMMVFDIYSKGGRAIIDLVPGRVDDPQVM